MEIDQTINSVLFKKNERDKLYKFLHECIDEITGCNGPLYQQYSNTEWTKEEFNHFHKQILKLLNKPNSLYCDVERMPQEFHQLPQHIQEAILICLRVRQNQLTDALLYNCSCKYKPTLLNYDWRLKYVMGSSKMASIRESLLQLDLICKDNNKDCLIRLELDKDELDTVINTLETTIR